MGGLSPEGQRDVAEMNRLATDYTPRVGDYVRRTVTHEGEVVTMNSGLIGGVYLGDPITTVTVEKIDPPLPPLPDHGVIHVTWRPGDPPSDPDILIRDPGSPWWRSHRWGTDWLPDEIQRGPASWRELVEKDPT